MANKNDKAIMVLKGQIAAKKEQLAKATSFSPKTNCSLPPVRTERINLHVADAASLTSALVELNLLKMSADGLDLKFTLGGFPVEDWMADIQARLTILNRTKEEQRLKALENQLTDLLSAEKKVELILGELKDKI